MRRKFGQVTRLPPGSRVTPRNHKTSRVTAIVQIMTNPFKKPATQSTRRTHKQKKTDLAEHPEVFNQVGLLFNEPPDTRRVALYLVIRDCETYPVRSRREIHEGSACYYNHIGVERG